MYYSCKYVGHEMEEITAYCCKFGCKDKPQCCSECLKSKHQDHKDDCHTKIRISQKIQNEQCILAIWEQEIQDWIQQFQEDQKNLVTSFEMQKTILRELKEKSECPNSRLSNLDIIRIKYIDQISRKLNSKSWKKALQWALLVKIGKFSETILGIGQSNIKEFQDTQDTVDMGLEEEIIVFCENQNCLDEQQCCDKCVMKGDQKNILFPVIQVIIQLNIENQRLQILLKIFSQIQYQFSCFSLFIKGFGQKFQELNQNLKDEEYYKFTENIKNLKQWNMIKFLVKQPVPEIFYQFLDRLIKFNDTLLKIDQIQNQKTILFVYKNETIYEEENQIKYLLAQGIKLLEQNRNQEAIHSFDQVISKQPKNAEAFFRKGLALQSLKRYNKAIQCYDEAIKNNPDFDKAHFRLTLFYMGRYKEAIKCYEDAIQLKSDSEVYYNNKGLALDELEQYVNAVECYDKAIEINPNYSNAFSNRGLALFYLKRYEEAIESYNKAISLDPNNNIAKKNKGDQCSLFQISLQEK